MSLLFIDAWQDNGEYFVNIKTFVILYMLQLSDSPKIQLKIRIVPSKPTTCLLNVNLSNMNYSVVSEIPDFAMLSKWPIILSNYYVVSGLCSVARQICKLSDKESIRDLLGFREACLVACAETSVWTRFCEIDITNTVEELLGNKCIENNCCKVPESIVKYENHLAQPVKIHNIYKIARNNMQDQSLQSSTPREQLNISHTYAEGPYITLADIILYACYCIIFKYFSSVDIPKINLTKSWFATLQSLSLAEPILKQLASICTTSNIFVPNIKTGGLYKTDSSEIALVNHTKQYKLENAFNSIEQFAGSIKNDLIPFGASSVFNWQTVPVEINPKGGSLPEKRADRKCQQLENLTKAVIEVVGDEKYRIVDFCSGSGHLGLLIASLLPQCLVILVEIKETSLARARKTIEKLDLKNVVIVQSNLDYFEGSFNLGVALHACGVASDLVMQKCIKNQANFICCPCCYGNINNCHEVTYPRSKKYKEMFESNKEQYFNLAHAADQTHDTANAKTKQGYFCMDIVDTDRKLYAEDCGYQVFLGKLQPPTCTNKNNLLVGVLKNN